MSRQAILAILFAIFSAAGTVVMPMLVGAYIDYYGMGANAAGQIASAELAGVAVGGLLVAATIAGRWRWLIPFAAIAAVLIGNLATLTGITAIFPVVRFIAGLGEGSSIAFMAATLAIVPRSERYFAMFFCAYLLAATGLFQVGSLAIARFGGVALFAGLAVLALIAIPMVLAGHSAQAPQPQDSKGAPVEPVAVALPEPLDKSLLGLALTMLFLFFVGCGSVWVFAERIGIEGGLTAVAARDVLAGSTLAGAAGAAIAAVSGGRFPRSVALAAGGALLIGSALMIAQGPEVLSFGFAASAFVFGWMFSIPFLMAIVAELDQQGRSASLAVGVQNIGQAVGPGLASLIIGGTHLTRIGWLAAGVLAVSMMLCALVQRQLRTPVRQLA